MLWCWRARVESLPLSRIISAEIKTYVGTWQPIELVCLTNRRDPHVRGVALNGAVYCSIQLIQPGSPTTYAATKMSLAEWRAYD
jgi:hypothetical protein